VDGTGYSGHLSRTDFGPYPPCSRENGHLGQVEERGQWTEQVIAAICRERILGLILPALQYPINPDGNTVDLYGYMSMAVAAIQVQSREIAALRAEVARLRRRSERQ
jgi:hypothetical protein